ncbi:MAG: GGDEF domain-containing protein [Burkholderiales bacterium]
MHKYSDSKESSAELLRLVLPMMAQHPSAFHPVSYSLWYEYVAGKNVPLKESIDLALKAGETFTEEKVAALYFQFIAERELAEGMRAQSNLERILADLGKTVAAASIQTSDYKASLDQHGETLKKGGDMPALEALVKSLVAATQTMHASSATLKKELESSNLAVEKLRADLVQAKGEAHTDPLTGIRNRRGLDEAVRKAEADEESAGLSGACLIILDIDHFKRCNDSYGHLFGDKVIRVTAQILASNVKGRDVVARIGGEEFAVFLPQTPLQGARTLAETLRSTVERGRIKRVETGETVNNITVSLGVAAYVPGESFENFMRRADLALYASKTGGRNRVSVADSASESAAANMSKKAANA